MPPKKGGMSSGSMNGGMKNSSMNKPAGSKPQKKGMGMMMCLLLIILAAAAGAAISAKVVGDMAKEKATPYAMIAGFNCVQSGGSFSDDGVCTCAEGMQYQAQAGYCLGEGGVPGGELGQKATMLMQCQAALGR